MRILVAGVGNIFFGDDAFGCEVARALVQSDLPEGVHVEDFGIRSYDLIYEILTDYEAVILVDAMQNGGAPGTLSLVEPELRPPQAHEPANVNAHRMGLMRVLETVATWPEKRPPNKPAVYLLGCQPALLEVEELGMSPQVAAAVPSAVAMVQSLVKRLQDLETAVTP